MRTEISISISGSSDFAKAGTAGVAGGRPRHATDQSVEGYVFAESSDAAPQVSAATEGYKGSAGRFQGIADRRRIHVPRSAERLLKRLPGDPQQFLPILRRKREGLDTRSRMTKAL